MPAQPPPLWALPRTRQEGDKTVSLREGTVCAPSWSQAPSTISYSSNATDSRRSSYPSPPLPYTSSSFQRLQQPVAAAPHPSTTDRVAFFQTTVPSPASSTNPTPPPPVPVSSSSTKKTPVRKPARAAATKSPALASTPAQGSGWSLAANQAANSVNSVTPTTLPNGGTPSRAMPPPAASSPATTSLAPPPEGIYRSFDDLLTAVQRVAKDNGYGVVKLRASNYREGKPTRYDLVCDRGGVKYNSTAKKRNPSTRKVDCPFRAKAVCEVQLGNQWRFAVQEPRHNHEARIPSAPPGQESTSIAQSLRSLTNKIDRMSHEMTQGWTRMDTRFDNIEKRMDAMERNVAMMNNMGNGMGGNMANNMGGNMGGVMDNRMNNVEARMSAVESRVNGLGMPMDDVDVESRLLSQSVM